ncbi:MAG: hypothetical protein ABFD96_20055 [Armatimonadia bacterium]
MTLGRRESWPSLIILGVGLLTLALVLKANQQDLPLQPTWLMAIPVVLYVLVQAIAQGPTAGALLGVVIMIVAHLFLALLMGLGYSAVEGQPRAAYGALQSGLWAYVPGTALQFAFACLTGLVFAAWHTNRPASVVQSPEEAPQPVLLPDLQQAPTAAAAVATAAAVPGVGAALLASADVVAAGAWERDPDAALARIQSLASRTGHGLNSVSLDRVCLLVRSEPGKLAALLVGSELSRPAGHDLLRDLWAAAERLTEQGGAEL